MFLHGNYLFNDDENAGSFHKIMIVAAQGRNTVMQFQKPMDLSIGLNQKDKSDSEITSELRQSLYSNFLKAALTSSW